MVLLIAELLALPLFIYFLGIAGTVAARRSSVFKDIFRTAKNYSPTHQKKEGGGEGEEETKSIIRNL